MQAHIQKGFSVSSLALGGVAMRRRAGGYSQQPWGGPLAASRASYARPLLARSRPRLDGAGRPRRAPFAFCSPAHPLVHAPSFCSPPRYIRARPTSTRGPDPTQWRVKIPGGRHRRHRGTTNPNLTQFYWAPLSVMSRILGTSGAHVTYGCSCPSHGATQSARVFVRGVPLRTQHSSRTERLLHNSWHNSTLFRRQRWRSRKKWLDYTVESEIAGRQTAGFTARM